MRKILAIIAIFISVQLFADTISWEPTLEREDGTPMTSSEIQGYKVYYSDGTSGVYPNVLDVGNVTSAIVDAIAVPRHVAVTTIDTGGRESGYSIEAVIPAQVTNQPPTGYWLASTPTEATAGDSITVGVGASDADGTVQAVTLYIDNTLIRDEILTPYLWNDKGQDAALQNMAAGVYTLRAQIADNSGLVKNITRVLMVLAAPNPPIIQ